MANDFLTVADLLADALDLSPAQVSDLVDSASFLARLPYVMSSNGTTHKYSKETGAPVVGFRSANAGRDFDHSVDTVVSVDLKILDFSWATDKAVADAWRQGGAEALVGLEGFRHLKAAMFKLEQQYFQGTDGDAAGFNGFTDAAGLDGLADAMVINAGGTTANTASSCWLMRLGEDDVTGVMREGSPVELGDTIVQNFTDGSGLNYPAYYTPGCSWQAVQIGGAYSVARIANLTEDAGKGLTDDLIYEAMAAFPGMRTPNVIVCSRRSLRQLRESRTATNVTGAPAPTPTEVGGVPIIVSEGISNTEALLT
jgi:hypothetical protein